MTDTQPPSSTQTAPSVAATSESNAQVPKVAKSRASLGTMLSVLVVLLMFSFVGVASVYYWQQLAQQKLLIQTLTKNSDARQRQVAQREHVVQTRFKAIDEKMLQQSLASKKLIQQSQFNSQQLHDLGARNRADWLLAEAEYLMHLANQRLLFEHDVRGAEAILIAADQVLSENDDPGLLRVRQALALEILSLQQTNMADIESVYLQLSAMIKSLDSLSEKALLKQEVDNTNKNEIIAGADSEASRFSWSGLWHEIWSDVQKVFIIRRLDHPVAPLLAPEQSYYLKQNLRLILEQTSLSLLDNNQETYQVSLEKASQWIQTYFDLENSETDVLLKRIEAMKHVSIKPAIPDISSSLRLLKGKIESMYLSHSLGKLAAPTHTSEYPPHEQSQPVKMNAEAGVKKIEGEIK